jgi:hypothetical protein
MLRSLLIKTGMKLDSFRIKEILPALIAFVNVFSFKPNRLQISFISLPLKYKACTSDIISGVNTGQFLTFLPKKNPEHLLP